MKGFVFHFKNESISVEVLYILWVTVQYFECGIVIHSRATSDSPQVSIKITVFNFKMEPVSI